MRRDGNRLLALLPEAERELLDEQLERISLEVKDVMFEANQPIEHVYFIETGVGSIISDHPTGRIEVATVGNEGMVGLPVFLGTSRVPLTAFMQVAGTVLRMPSQALRDAVNTPDSMLREILNRYTEGLMFQIAQSAACRSLHPVAQRAARWLLLTHDRVGGDEFGLTQEFLAQMLGVRRASVSEVEASLKQDGLIDYERGCVRIVDRSRLEQLSCECYALIEREYDRVLSFEVTAARA
jgi:CRP-like cAMP-binding protein